MPMMISDGYYDVSSLEKLGIRALYFHAGVVKVLVDDRDEAVAFKRWLEESEAKAQYGFMNMPG
jgi:hypothetical protein